jgi:hypothetical protein
MTLGARAQVGEFACGTVAAKWSAGIKQSVFVSSASRDDGGARSNSLGFYFVTVYPEKGNPPYIL